MSQCQREYARIDVRLRGAIRPLDEEAVEQLRVELLTAPSVWSPGDEGSLREIVAGASAEEAVLARGILDLANQFVRLKAMIEKPPGDTTEVDVSQLSGGGGKLHCAAPLRQDDLLEIRYLGEEIPPVRAMIRIVHVHGDEFGYTYEAIHAGDKDKLIRLIYQLQRVALREAQV